MKSGRLVTQGEVWYKIYSNSPEGPQVFNIPKTQCSLLKHDNTVGQIQCGTRKAWAWSTGQGQGHLGQWEPPYSCAAETQGPGHSLTHICIPCGEE